MLSGDVAMWDLGGGGDFDEYGINRDNGAIVVLLSSYLHGTVTPLDVFNWSMRVGSAQMVYWQWDRSQVRCPIWS